MPFSIKRFTIHRSSSLPTHSGPRDKKGEEHPTPPQGAGGGRALKKSASQEEKRPKHSSRSRGLPSSQSVDTADLRRMGYTLGHTPPPPDERLIPPALPPSERMMGCPPPPNMDYAGQRFQPSPYGPPNPNFERHFSNSVAPRWRSSGKERRTAGPPDTRALYEQGPGGELRRVSVKKNGVRFQDSDIGTEESQSTSSSSGGGGGGGVIPPIRGEYWEEPKYIVKDNSSRWGNGRRGNRNVMGSSGRQGEWASEDGMAPSNGGGSRGKRSQQRRHHSSAMGAEPAILQDSRPRMEVEGQAGNRNPIYTPPPSLYDEDPGIMSEVETSATGFRRGNKGRQNLPVVRTPSKSQDRPMGPVSPQLRQENLTLGLVFLQYRSETKRALLPNEITTLDTVKALFVRSFPKQLTMEYLDSPHIRIYIHDTAKDMFYELEDLRDIRDRAVLRIYEQDINGEGIYSTWEQELSYFSEPEFDSEYQNQHIHRAKQKNAAMSGGYYNISAYSPVGRAQTLPPGASLRAFSPLPPEPPRTKPSIPVPSVAYAQTLPWGAHIVTYTTGPPSPPEKRPKEILIPTGMIQPPPKPQRSFQQTAVPMGKGIRSTPPPTGPPPSIPSPRSAMARPVERRHEPQGGYRPPPERPYSAGAQPIYNERLYEPAYQTPPVRQSYEPGYLSSPERRYEPQRTFAAYPVAAQAPPPPATTPSYDEPYYGERIYGTTKSGSITPVVDEEARMRVEYMERQLASLTGLVQKALSTPPPRPSPTPPTSSQQQQQVPTRDTSITRERSEEYYDAKSKVSPSSSIDDTAHESHAEMSRHAFKEEKSVSFSDETTTVSSPVQKQHSPQHAAERPAKPAIKSALSTRSHSIEMDVMPTQLNPPTVKVTTADRAERESFRSKPAPPPKPASLSSSSSCEGRQYSSSPPTRGKIRLSPELYSHLKHLKKQTKDLKLEVRNLRRIAQSQAFTAKEAVRETCLKIKTMLTAAQSGEEHVCAERLKVSREEDLYRQDVSHLERDLLDLERQVEELRGNVINRKCRVNLGNVEGMALILSRASKMVADLKARFPALQENLRTIMAVEMEVVVREEKFLKDEPERLESALRRCKKLTGTLVTLKRLASVQEQRHTVGHHLPEKSHSAEGPYSDGEVHSAKSASFDSHTVIHVPPDGHQRRGETALDALLSELQTFNVPAEQKRDVIPGLLGTQRRLPSYPSTDSPVRSPIHGYVPPGSKSPTPDAKSGNTLQVTGSGKNLSPTPQLHPERRLSPTTVSVSVTSPEVVTRHSPNIKQMINGPETVPAAALKKVPPQPPPRTTSKSPITSPTSMITGGKTHQKDAVPNRVPVLSHLRSSSVPPVKGISERPPIRQAISARQASREDPAATPPTKETVIIRTSAITDDTIPRDQLSSNSSSSESVNSQEGVQMALQVAKMEQSRKVAQLRNELAMTDDVFKKPGPGGTNTPPRNRQELLEQRHQELLRKQKQLQEQYTRLQQMQRGQVFNKFGRGDLKKTGSESNILSKATLSLTPASGSMQHLAITTSLSNPIAGSFATNSTPNAPALSPGSKIGQSTTNKVFETDIL